MLRPVKRVVKKSVAKILGDVMASNNSIEQKINSLHQTLWDVNKDIIQKQEELNYRSSEEFKNSGILHISSEEIIAKIFSGLKIYLDPRDISVTPHLALDAIWEYQITKAWLNMVTPDAVVLDIGANFGYFGALAAQKTSKKTSKIVFFEPNPKLLGYIKKTLAVNWLNEQSVIENLAVGATNSKARLNVLKDYIGSSSLLDLETIDSYMHEKMYLETTEVVEVDVVTIDSYCKRNNIPQVNLIKMDIEGFEDRAYAGMRKVVQSSPDVTMFIEFTEGSYKDPKGFYHDMLEDFGYVYVINQDGSLLKPKDQSYDTVIGKPEDWVMPVFSKNKNLDKKTEQL